MKYIDFKLYYLFERIIIYVLNDRILKISIYKTPINETHYTHVKTS